MPEEDKSLDLTGVGKLAKAIPERSWQKLVNTACDTFKKTVAPITATTGGIGRLIEAKFNGMVDAQKVLAAETVKRAKEKVDASSKKPKGRLKSVIIVNAIEKASIESDDTIRDIWSNLIANEILDGSVHPEFPKILERISSNDAVVLLEIAEGSKKEKVKWAVRTMSAKIAVLGIAFEALLEEESDFHREHLKNLNLIKKVDGGWKLTLIGEEFLKSVTDPSAEIMTTEPGAAGQRR